MTPLSVSHWIGTKTVCTDMEEGIPSDVLVETFNHLKLCSGVSKTTAFRPVTALLALFIFGSGLIVLAKTPVQDQRFLCHSITSLAFVLCFYTIPRLIGLFLSQLYNVTLRYDLRAYQTTLKRCLRILCAGGRRYSCVRHQGRTEVIWHPGSPFANIRSFGRKCTVLKNVGYLRRWWDFSALPGALRPLYPFQARNHGGIRGQCTQIFCASQTLLCLNIQWKQKSFPRKDVFCLPQTLKPGFGPSSLVTPLVVISGAGVLLPSVLGCLDSKHSGTFRLSVWASCPCVGRWC